MICLGLKEERESDTVVSRLVIKITVVKQWMVDSHGGIVMDS